MKVRFIENIEQLEVFFEAELETVAAGQYVVSQAGAVFQIIDVIHSFRENILKAIIFCVVRLVRAAPNERIDLTPPE